MLARSQIESARHNWCNRFVRLRFWVVGKRRKIRELPVSQSFLSYSPWVRRTFVVMIVTGFISIGFGAFTDVGPDDWSQNLGFITNIWAGFTSFLIGVPVALIALSTITRQSEDYAASKRVEDLSKIAWERFRDSVRDFCNNDR